MFYNFFLKNARPFLKITKWQPKTRAFISPTYNRDFQSFKNTFWICVLIIIVDQNRWVSMEKFGVFNEDWKWLLLESLWCSVAAKKTASGFTFLLEYIVYSTDFQSTILFSVRVLYEGSAHPQTMQILLVSFHVFTVPTCDVC